MFEYRVRAPETSGTGDIEDICNQMAADGWRLVTSTAVNSGALNVRLYLFFERAMGEQRAPQDTWRTQHRGRDDEPG
jgi:hypothetical protein